MDHGCCPLSYPSNMGCFPKKGSRTSSAENGLMATNTAEEAKHENEAVVGTSGGSGGGGSGGVVSSSEVVLKKGPWTAAEDAVLKEYVTKHGEGNWNAVQKNTGLARCGKSCRLRWANHLRPNLKKGAFSPEEEKLILELHAQFGNKWARMAALLPGRTDNEIKNYWNTRVKRRQRQGLPLYSDEPANRSTTSPKPIAAVAAAAPAPNNATTHLDFLHHHHHYHPLLSPTLPSHYSPLSPQLQLKPTISDPMIPLSSPSSSSTPSPHSFVFSRPAPLLCNPLGFKRFRSSSGLPLRVAPNTILTSSSLPDQPVTTAAATTNQSVGYSGGFGFTGQVNPGLSHVYQAPLSEYNRGMVLNQFANSPAKLELIGSNQFSQPNILQPESKFKNMQMNKKTSDGGNGFLVGPLFEAQNLTSSQTALKRPSYLFPDEGNNLDGHRRFDDLPLNPSNCSSNAGLKLKEEAQDLSKSMNDDDDLSSMLAGMPPWPTVSVSELSIGNAAAAEVFNIIPDDNFELDTKPMASFFPITTTTNHNNDNSECFTWDDLPEFC